MRIALCVVLLAATLVLVACAQALTEDDVRRIVQEEIAHGPPPTLPTIPTALDLLCEEAVEELRETLNQGAIMLRVEDPNGHLTSFVEECMGRE